MSTDAPVSTVCPHCGEPIDDADQWCEACGQPVGTADPGAAAAARPPPDANAELGTQLIDPPEDASTPVTHCSCGGTIDADGWCTICGLRAPSERDHFTVQPAAHVAAVCDRGLHHPRNEDAVAVAASDHRTVLVVCDGVTNTTDSDAAALAAARAARDALAAVADAPSTAPIERIEYWRAQCNAATHAAQAAAVEAASHVGNVTDPPSCTYVALVVDAVVVDAPVLAAAWIGDSRAYWFGDDGTATQLSTDDSWASGEIAQGVARAVAEADPRAHSITRWLGVDSPGGDPSFMTLVAPGPGWVLVCSDGLWNYCSDAVALRDLLRSTTAEHAGDPLASAGALVDWANAQGGHDNITAALARVTPSHPA
jgi:serine/threonine protein phosphatase PrpC